MLGKLTKGLRLESEHGVCAWLVNTGFVLDKLTRLVCLVSLVSLHRVCAF